MRADKPVLMSTHGDSSSANALRSLNEPRDLAAIAPTLAEAGLSHVTQAYVWAFKNGSQVINTADPIRGGDLCVTTTRSVAHADVLVERLFPVIGVLRDAPDIPQALAINWRGEGWDNVVLLGEPLVLDPPVPFAELDAQFAVRPGQMWASKFLRPSVDELLEWLSGHGGASVGPAARTYPAQPQTTVMPAANKATVTRRLAAVSFRREVSQAYGTACAACGFDPGFFTAAHLKDWAKGGPDEWWNGLPLCPNHHVLFDLGRIRVVPEALEWVPGPGDTLPSLGVTRGDIKTLPNIPLPEMVKWKWVNPVTGR